MGGKTRVEFYGTTELLQKLEKAGGNLEKEITKAFERSIKKPKQEMLDFIKQHKQTGVTEESFVENIKSGKENIFCEVGFSTRKGGIASIFLNVGTPFMEPTFFIDNAVENNLDEIKKEQENALKEAFKELL